MKRAEIHVLIAIVFLGTIGLTAQAPGGWITGTFAPLPEPEEEYTAAVADDRLYLIGGNRGQRKEWPRHVLAYDLAADRWSTNKPVPFPGDHMAAAALGGKIFRDVEVFDPAINDWYRLPPMPTPRHGVNLAGYRNRLHAIGGHVAFAATGGTALHTPAHEVFEFNAMR